MHENATKIAGFHAAFAALNAKEMGTFYAPEVRFHDPAFGELRGSAARAMWSMLCHNLGKQAADGRVDMPLVFHGYAIEADEFTGSARWDATYRYGSKLHLVQNQVQSTFKFKDGLIVEHVDSFDHAAWIRQAFDGPVRSLADRPAIQSALRIAARLKLLKFRLVG